MADNFEKNMPAFWKKVGTKAFEITGAISLTLFISLNVEMNGLRSQVNDLNRYRQELVPRDEAQRQDEQRDARHQDLRQTVDKSMKEWRDGTLHTEEESEKFAEEADRSLQTMEKEIGELRVRLATLETRPNPEPEKKKQPGPLPVSNPVRP